MSEPDVSDLITVQQAIAILDASPVKASTRRASIHDAIGLRLAKEILADRDYPPADKSLMDGFAVRSADAVSGAELGVVGETRAGQGGEQAIGPGEAISIMTGAPLPGGADGVVPIELVERTESTIRIARPGDYSRFVARRGSDCRAGDRVLDQGMLLGAAQLAAAATVGAVELEVLERPRVAILATGDELLDPAEKNPGLHQIRNSNSIMLNALLRGYGCDVTDLGVAHDQMSEIVQAIERGATFDALFITGGMSVGAYDLPPKALQQLGADIRITKLKIKPGKPFIYAGLGECHVFGLPGNPLAGFVCTVRLASRVLRRMSGGEAGGDEISATLATPLPANGPREFYQPARVEGSIVHALSWKSSADVFTLACANALIIRPENDASQPAGAACRLLKIP